MVATRALAVSGPIPGIRSSLRLASLSRVPALDLRFQVRSSHPPASAGGLDAVAGRSPSPLPASGGSQRRSCGTHQEQSEAADTAPVGCTSGRVTVPVQNVGMKTLFLVRHAKSSWDDAA